MDTKLNMQDFKKVEQFSAVLLGGMLANSENPSPIAVDMAISYAITLVLQLKEVEMSLGKGYENVGTL